MGNKDNGSGKGIKKTVFFAGAEEFDSSSEIPRGFKTQVDGTVEIRCTDDAALQNVFAVAGAVYLYDLREVGAGGSVPFANIEFIY